MEQNIGHIVKVQNIGLIVKVQYMMYGWYMVLHQFLDNSDSPSIVEQ